MMPELPEVETIKRDLQKALPGTRIQRVRIPDSRVIRNISPREFTKRLHGRTIQKVSRRGKALIIDFLESPDRLIVQLMMTGQLILSRVVKPQNPTKVIFTLSNKMYLLYNDVRLFGRLQLVRELKELKYFRVLGPEPLSPNWHGESLRVPGSRRPIKSVLLDHSVVAGIGNIYAAEILFESGIRPLRPAGALTFAEQQRLCRASKRILRAAIRARGTSMNSYRDSLGEKGQYIRQLRVYGRSGEPCWTCRQPLQTIKISGRSSVFCPHCQE